MGFEWWIFRAKRIWQPCHSYCPHNYLYSSTYLFVYSPPSLTLFSIIFLSQFFSFEFLACNCLHSSVWRTLIERTVKNFFRCCINAKNHLHFYLNKNHNLCLIKQQNFIDKISQVDPPSYCSKVIIYNSRQGLLYRLPISSHF